LNFYCLLNFLNFISQLLFLFADLHTLDDNIEHDKYTSLDSILIDIEKIFSNCRLFNGSSTSYYKCAVRLEKWVQGRVSEIRDRWGQDSTNVLSTEKER